MAEFKKLELVKNLKKTQGDLDMGAIVEEFGAWSVTLSKPFKWGDKEYTEIDMDFASLTGEDIENLSDEMSDLGYNVSNTVTDKRYHRYLAARAAGIDADMISKLPAVDYNQVTGAARYFLTFTA